MQKDFPNLINYNLPGSPGPASQGAASLGGASQGSAASGVSTASTKSWIEEANPVPPKQLRKAFEDLVPKSQKRQTDEAYTTALEEAERLNMEPEALFAYYGERYFR